MKLYYASSTRDNFAGYDRVKLLWFHCDRSQPPCPYAELIDGYEDPDHDLRDYAEGAVNLLFTDEEVEALRAYLADRHGLWVDVEEANLPLPKNSVGIIILHEREEFIYNVCDEEGYSLPFKVAAYYNLLYPPPSLSLPQPDIELCTQFAEVLLRELDLPAVDQATLQGILVRIRNSTGLFVMQGKSRKEELDWRIRARVSWEQRRARGEV